MKNPLLKYVLLTLAIIVWGIVFYKVYTGLFTTRVNSLQEEHRISVDVKIDSLLLNYRNPFAEISEPASKPPVREMLPIRQIPQSSGKQPVPVGVMYLGRIVRDKRVHSILKFSAEHRLLQKGDTVQGLKIIEIFEDSIKIQYEDTFYIINMSR